jgi:hypothetical protein
VNRDNCVEVLLDFNRQVMSLTSFPYDKTQKNAFFWGTFWGAANMNRYGLLTQEVASRLTKHVHKIGATLPLLEPENNCVPVRGRWPMPSLGANADHTSTAKPLLG